MTHSIETWLPVPSYPKGYEVSSHGNVRSLYRGRRHLKPAVNRSGYQNVVLYSDEDGKPKTQAVHRLVAIAFVPNPNQLPWVNHIDGDKLNNSVSNLEWCSPSYNNKHAVVAGLKKPQRGERNGNSIFSDRERRVILRLGEIGFSKTAIAEMFEAKPGTIQRIISVGS